jgi:hypothetical protein
MEDMDILKVITRICLVSLLWALVPTGDAVASWLIFSKPAYEGQIVDIDTKEPIEGAVVVAIYNTEVLGIGDNISHVVNVKEAETDKDGMFHIPSYTTMIIPNSWEEQTTFIVYKPGYVSVNELDLEDCFTGECEKRNMKWFAGRSDVVYVLSSRRVELSKLSSGKDRLSAMPSFLEVRYEGNVPHLMNLKKREHDKFYIQ